MKCLPVGYQYIHSVCRQDS